MPISSEHLDSLIASLREYASEGVVDPWILADGSVLQPLDALIELRQLRSQAQDSNQWAYLCGLAEGRLSRLMAAVAHGTAIPTCASIQADQDADPR